MNWKGYVWIRGCRSAYLFVIADGVCSLLSMVCVRWERTCPSKCYIEWGGRVVLAQNGEIWGVASDHNEEVGGGNACEGACGVSCEGMRCYRVGKWPHIKIC